MSDVEHVNVGRGGGGLFKPNSQNMSDVEHVNAGRGGGGSLNPIVKTCQTSSM